MFAICPLPKACVISTPIGKVNSPVLHSQPTPPVIIFPKYTHVMGETRFLVVLVGIPLIIPELDRVFISFFHTVADAPSG